MSLKLFHLRWFVSMFLVNEPIACVWGTLRKEQSLKYVSKVVVDNNIHNLDKDHAPIPTMHNSIMVLKVCFKGSNWTQYLD